MFYAAFQHSSNKFQLHAFFSYLIADVYTFYGISSHCDWELLRESISSSACESYRGILFQPSRPGRVQASLHCPKTKCSLSLARSNHENLVVASVDIRKAFDSISHEAIQHTPREGGTRLPYGVFSLVFQF